MVPTTALPSTHDQQILALVADRDETTRRMYAEYLKRASCEISEAADGREALAKAISTRPDIIVTATKLPGINGFDLCDLLRRDTTTQTIPIVVVTEDEDLPADRRRAEQVGADVVLVKPCLPEHLLAAMREVLERSARLRTHAKAVGEKLAGQLSRSEALIQRSHQSERKSLSKAYERRDTTAPPIEPPALICPTCDQPLVYQRSHIGGVSARHPEQWDYYVCAAGCGMFQYRERTRKLRRVL